ncbi:MAG TPA: ABC transporter substrate-binding protein [Rhizomicrobium sp.]
MGLKHKALAFGLAMVATGAFAPAASAAPLTIGYSDWPGWVAWEVAIKKGWFKEAGLDVKFEWFDYSASLDAFSAKKLDAVLATNGDTLATGAGGGKGVMIMLTDYSSGNDMVVGRPGVKKMTDLKGKKVGVEEGLVDHLLLDTALMKNGMGEKDITLVNGKTNDLPQVLGSGQVSAVALWQPNAGTAMQTVPGSRPLFTSAQAPGLIYDVLTVNPASLSAHKADWIKLVRVWDKVVAYIEDPKTQADAVVIMSGRDGLKPAAYKAFLDGTHLLTLKAGAAAFKKGPGLDSIYGSTSNADAFNLRNKVYKTAQPLDTYIDPSITAAALK